MPMPMPVPDELRFAQKWYKEAKRINIYDDDSKNAIFRFMAFWMAFNSYYGDPFNGGEKKNIKLAVRQNYDSLAKYNPFENGSNSLIYRLPVLDAKVVGWLHNTVAKQEMLEYQTYINNGGVPILSPTEEQHKVAIDLLSKVEVKLDSTVKKLPDMGVNPNGKKKKRPQSPIERCRDSIQESIKNLRSLHCPYHTITEPDWNDLDAGDSHPITCTFFTLYQIRCNLFHGSKEPTNARDFELVKEAALILEGYLDRFL